MILPPRAKSILSIQSHVVHGYVGNKASTFPLQVLNWDVDVLNTVNFSNHTGYGEVQGTASTEDQLKNIYEGLHTVGVSYDALLTGYTPDAATLEAVGEIGEAVKNENSNCIWLLDPVMGDEGHLYVSDSVIPTYRKILETRKIDIVTPNQFEAELLLGMEINSIETLQEAIFKLHERFHLEHVVITSLSKSFAEHLDLEDHEEFIYTAVSSRNVGEITLFKVPQLDSYFTGVGDLFSALLIDRVSKGLGLIDSVDEVLTVMAKVLKITQLLTIQKVGKNVQGSLGDPKTMRECELRIVECKDLYDSTEKKFSPFPLSQLNR